MRPRFIPRTEQLEDRSLMTVISGSGGVGGTTQTIALNPDLNLVRFQWQNYTIPDEFQISYQGQRIAGDVNLQSGGDSGSKVVTAHGSNDQLTVKVTAPTVGTAWDFTVEVLPFELTVDGMLGDVVKVDIPRLLQNAGISLADADLTAGGFSLADSSNARGKVAETDDMQADVSKGVFYFVPTVTGKARDYNDAVRGDKGIGESKLVVKNNGHEIPVNIRISNGASTTGDGAVTFDTKKLDIYRQEQRLAYLGYPGSAGGPLTVDGVSDADTVWAKKLFSIALDPAVSGRGITVAAPAQGTKYLKEQINNPASPAWNKITNISRFAFSSTDRQYGMDASGRFIERAFSALPIGPQLPSTGVALKNGEPGESKTHVGGRAVDIDDVELDFFRTTVKNSSIYVSSPGGKVIVKDGSTYRAGNPNTPSDLANGLKESVLKPSLAGLNPAQRQAKKAEVVATLTAIRSLMDYKLSETDVRSVLDAFINAGTPLVFYNDPRFFGYRGVVSFEFGHYNHYHFHIPSPIAAVANALSITAQPAASSLFGPSSFGPSSSSSGRLSAAVNLGRFDGTKTVTGSLTAAQPEQIYRVEIGDVNADFDEGTFFDTPRNLSVLLSGLTDDADAELIVDSNGDGEGQVLLSAPAAGPTSESIDATDLPTGVYYIRVFRRGGDTGFTLAATVPPLPVPADGAGNTPATAADLGSLGSGISRQDFVGEVDETDFYRFTLPSMSDLDVTLGGLSQGDVSLTIGRDSNLDGVLDPGESIAVSDAEGEDGESLHLDRLPAGTYLVQVARVSGNTGYGIQLAAAPSVTPVDAAGDTPTTAFAVGSLTGPRSFSDFVGDVDPVDLYRFSVSSVTGLSVSLSGLSADADLEVFRDANGDGRLDAGEVRAASRLSGSQAESVGLAGLVPGEYFVRVTQYEGDTTYTLSLIPTPASGANLAVTRAGPTSDLGTTFTYTVRVTNNGPAPASNVVLTELLPAGLQRSQVVGPSGGTVQLTATGFVGRVPTLPAGGTAVFSVTVRSFITGDLLGVSSVTSATPDFDPADNRLEWASRVNAITSPPADLELTQTASTLTPRIGDSVTFTLTLANRGPGTATVIRVRDALPAGLSFVSSAATLGSYAAGTGVWTVGNMPPNSSVQLRITARVVSGSVLINTAEVVAVDEADPDSTPNNGHASEDDQASVTVRVQGAGPTGVTGVFPDPLNPGQNALFVIGTAGADTIAISRGGADVYTVSNIGASSSQDTFPGPVSRVVVYAGGGNDYVWVDGSVGVSAWVYGGEGNDALYGGSGANVLLGEGGDDTLVARGTGAVMIGGTGRDLLIGGFGDDLVVAGSTAFDADEGALFAIQSEWQSGRSYADRVANLRGQGAGPRANGDVFLVANGAGQTAFDDGTADVLLGSFGRNWYFANLVGGAADSVIQTTDEIDELV